jgi:hypothetical protein
MWLRQANLFHQSKLILCSTNSRVPQRIFNANVPMYYSTALFSAYQLVSRSQARLRHLYSNTKNSEQFALPSLYSDYLGVLCTQLRQLFLNILKTFFNLFLVRITPKSSSCLQCTYTLFAFPLGSSLKWENCYWKYSKVVLPPFFFFFCECSFPQPLHTAICNALANLYFSMNVKSPPPVNPAA